LEGEECVTKNLFALLISVLAAFPTSAQQPSSEQSPKTKLETFSAQTGSVIIQGFTTIGVLHGEYGSVTVTAKEFTNATSGKKEHGIMIEVREAGRIEREHRSFIDFDEIEPLMKGIDYVAKVDRSATKLQEFQADYRTKGELEITTFSNSDGSISAAVKSGRIGGATAFLKLQDLQRLRELIIASKTKLEAVRGTA
jgi:hypothetical protein